MATKTLSFLKDGNRDFDNILDSYLNLTDGGTVAAAATFSSTVTAGTNATDEHKFTGHMNTRYMEFLAGVEPLASTALSASSELTAVTFVDADVDAGVTLSSSAVHNAAWIGNATSAVTLPAATVGNFVMWRQTAQADEANAITFTCAGTDNFEANQVVHAGGEIVGDVSAADASADKALAITPAATNCGWGHTGSTCTFYCRTKGRWLVKLVGRNLGTGVAGAVAFA
tara:strand:- start:54 stop:737 length:684 start_codon:yes stop_codon:yes gene_type:complete